MMNRLTARASLPLALILLLSLGVATSTSAQTPLASSCSPNTSPSSDADASLYLEDWGKAAHLYHDQLQKNPTSLEAQAGLIRVLLGQGRIDEALKEAVFQAGQHRDSAITQTILAETFIRRGELASATPILARALTLDRCYARAHLQEARLQALTGYHASAARQLEQAHTLDPNDEQITLAWMFSLPPAERFPKLKEFVASAKFLNPSDREDLRSNILEGEARMNSPCTVSSPASATTLPLVVNPNLGRDPGHPSLDVGLNGKTHRMFFGTSGSGIVLTPAIARSMNLTPTVKFSYSQLYSGGRIHFYLANLASIRLANIEFHNCLITVVDELPNTEVGHEAGIRNPSGADGFLGAGFLTDFLVDVDTPKRLLHLTPLSPPASITDPKDLPTWSHAAESNGNPVPSMNGGAWGQYNRTIPLDKKDWASLIEFRGETWIPTHVGGGAPLLFVLELADPWPRISTTASARTARIETLNAQQSLPFKGYFLEFAGRFVPINSWTSERYDEFSKHLRLETSGTIGGEALRQLDMTLDYRDNLVHFAYPK